MKNISTLILTLLSFTLSAQQVGDFNLTNVLDGKSVALKDYAAKPGVIIIFTANSCPFDEYYAGRIKAIDKLPVILVNAHPDPTESSEAMIKRAHQLGYTTPYLADKDQTLMQALGASKSTEAFLLKNTNGSFAVFYHGAIDDNPQVVQDVKHAYLNEAINLMLSGQSMDKTQVRPTGCNIRKK